MIPDEPAVLGEPEPASLGPEIDVDAAELDADPVTPTGGGPGPSIDIKECPNCDTPLTGNYDAETLTCDECGRVVLTEAERQRRRREARLREAHNDGSFMPLSPKEWYDRRGGR
ncbi:hypothetical protein DJ76_10330 [Halorubrum ezzemoulense]|uniref:Uncharacterized protein n=2 Tax=Halorubrum ezzemoulense TaxID=337243 RepID=A0A256JWD2_HALEZ|nr:hypothetical protein DJ76_10330 [Halorubrum ezzemoulense]